MDNAAHVLWIEGQFPPFTAINVQAFKKLNPEWHVFQWYDHLLEMNGFFDDPIFKKISKEFDNSISHLPPIARKYASTINKSNIIRMLILKKYGGLYFDTDCLFLEPFVNEHPDQPKGVNSWIYMFIPKDWPLWDLFITHYLQMVPMFIAKYANHKNKRMVIRSHYLFWRLFFNNVIPGFCDVSTENVNLEPIARHPCRHKD